MADPDIGFDADGRSSAVPYRRLAGLRPSRATGEGEEGEYFLKAPNGQLLVLGEPERLIWELLDGSHNFDQIRRRFRQTFGRDLGAANLAKFIRELLDAGAVEPLPPSQAEELLDGTRIRKIELAADPLTGGRQPGTGSAIPVSGDQPRARRRGQGAMMRGGGGRGRGTREAMRTFWSVRLGNPERLLATLAAIYWPIRYAGWLLIPLFVTAALITIKHKDQYYADWITLLVSIPAWPCFYLAEHITTWSARVAEAIVIHGFGGRVTEARLKLFLGIFIRLQFEHSSVEMMTRRQKLWIAATPLLWRLATFSGSMVVWAMLRPAHPAIAHIAMFMAGIGLITFVTAACPLLPLYGYKFLEILLHQENLRGRAFKFLALKARGRAAPDALTVAERWGLLLMALGTALMTSLFLLHILYHANSRAIDSLGGLGLWFGLSITGMAVLYVVGLYRYSGKLRAMGRAGRVREGSLGASSAPAE